MEQITVTKKSTNNFLVVVGNAKNVSRHTVELDERYYQALTGATVSPEQLIESSFRFLLDHESREAILPSFNLSVIEKYFPEYPEAVQKYL